MSNRPNLHRAGTPPEWSSIVRAGRERRIARRDPDGARVDHKSDRALDLELAEGWARENEARRRAARAQVAADRADLRRQGRRPIRVRPAAPRPLPVALDTARDLKATADAIVDVFDAGVGSPRRLRDRIVARASRTPRPDRRFTAPRRAPK